MRHLLPVEPGREGREAHADGSAGRRQDDEAGSAAGRQCGRAGRGGRRIMSMAPCSSRNSLRWKPSGRVSRTVCWITRGPAKPISALRLGDVDVAEHREARRHAAGRRVGLHRDERQAVPPQAARARRSSSPSAAATAALPACAPRRSPRSTRPAARCSMACSTPRTKRSPTTEPIEPPMNENSKAQATISMPSSVPLITTQRVALADRLSAPPAGGRGSACCRGSAAGPRA